MKKEIVLSVFGCFGAWLVNLMGGYDVNLKTLLVVMAIDIITAVIVSGVFNNSTKTDTGALSSQEFIKGIFKKFVMILIVVMAVQVDNMLGVTYIRNCTIIAFIANEALSIIENCGLMGIPIPEVITNAIEVLKNNSKES